MRVIARRPAFAAAAAVLLALVAGCALPPTPPERTAGATTDCQVVFDAGSSGTRLYLYERRTDGGWTERAGPRVGALADPVRQIRGKTHADIEPVTAEVVDALERVRRAGPPDASGRPAWEAFDWKARCRVTAAGVYATAGMRIAEQEDRVRSAQLWKRLTERLQAAVGPGVPVSTRTLTGFEEGLFAWLAVAQDRTDLRFGIAEMGGASSQVTFPCPGCDASDDAVRTVTVRGRPLVMYSHSFLGLGQDEAPKVLGLAPECAYGVGAMRAGWTPGDCAARIPLRAERPAGTPAATPVALRDPYNFGQGVKGTTRAVPTGRADVTDWVLTGAFNYWREDQVQTCCITQGNCFGAESSCFRAVYLPQYLQALQIPTSSRRADASWTLGAVICADTRCMAATPRPVCGWSDRGCL